MNYKVSTLLAFASGAACLNAEIPISDVLSVEGFIASAYAYTDSEVHLPGGKVSESDNSFDVDQVEIDFLFDFGALTAQVDVQSLYLDDLEVEQAFFTYALNNGASVTAGRYDSWLGLEAFEPTGRFHYSNAYDPHLEIWSDVDLATDVLDYLGLPIYWDNFGAILGAPAPRQQNGIRYAHPVANGWVGISLQDGYIFEDGRLGGDSDFWGGPSSFAVELAAGYVVSENLDVQIGGFVEEWDHREAGYEEDGRNWGLNAHATYQLNNWTLAGELFFTQVDGDFENEPGAASGKSTLETFGGLISANYALSDINSITARLSYVDSEGDVREVSPTETFELDGHVADYYKATVAYNHAVTANLLIVTEVSYVDGNLMEQDYDAMVGAVQAVFTF